MKWCHDVCSDETTEKSHQLCSDPQLYWVFQPIFTNFWVFLETLFSPGFPAAGMQLFSVTISDKPPVHDLLSTKQQTETVKI